MRYLIITPDFPPAVGGIQTLVAGLAGELARRNEVTVVAPHARGARSFDAAQPYRVRRFRGGPAPLGRICAAVAAVAAARRCDAIICGHVAAAAAAFLARTIWGKPYFVYVHALEVTSRRWRRARRFLLQRAAGVIAGSRYARDLAATYAGIPAETVTIIPPAVAPALVRAADDAGGRSVMKDTDEKVLLSVGRLAADERYKGHDCVIRALPMIRRCVPRCVYWVAGGGDDAPRLRALAAALDVEAAVKFGGEVEDVAPYYRACDVFVMPSRRVREDGMEKAEGFGLAFLEASLFKKPVVAGRCGGALDAVSDGETGLLVDPKSPTEVAAAVVALLLNPNDARRMGVAGYERVMRNFTAARQARAFEEAIRGRVVATGELSEAVNAEA